MSWPSKRIKTLERNRSGNGRVPPMPNSATSIIAVASPIRRKQYSREGSIADTVRSQANSGRDQSIQVLRGDKNARGKLRNLAAEFEALHPLPATTRSKYPSESG
jgi:hypothetical protein